LDVPIKDTDPAVSGIQREMNRIRMR